MCRDEAKFLTKGDNNNADDTTLFGKGYVHAPPNLFLPSPFPTGSPDWTLTSRRNI